MVDRRGFTLFDFMVGIAIIGILLGLGTPGLSHFVAKHKADATARTLWRGLAKAREAAVLSGKPVTFCGVDSDGLCIRDDIRAFMIFHDRDNDRRLSGEETPIQRVELDFPGSVTLRASNQMFISYSHDGYAKQFGSIVLCHQNKQPRYIRRVTVNRAGRSYMARDLNGDGIVEATDGTVIDCN